MSFLKIFFKNLSVILTVIKDVVVSDDDVINNIMAMMKMSNVIWNILLYYKFSHSEWAFLSEC